MPAERAACIYSTLYTAFIACHRQPRDRARILSRSNMPGVIVQPDSMEATDSPTSRFYVVPQERVVSIEHPCIVRNFDNGVKSLGGEPQMKHVSVLVQRTSE